MRNDFRIGLYEKAMPDFARWEDKLLLTKRCGFDWMEISIDESEKKLARLDYSAEKRSALKRAITSTGVPVHTMCLSGHRKYPLGSHDAAVRAKALEIMDKAVSLASELGVRIIQLAGYDVFYEQGDSDTQKYFAENLYRCVELAARSGVLLGFETMENAFLDTVEKGMAHVSRVNSPYLGMYPDLGNLKNAAVIYGTDVAEDLKTGAGHIFAAHLKETAPGKYRDMFLGAGGHTEYERCLNELWTQGVRMFTAEFWYHGESDYEQRIQSAAQFAVSKIGSACEYVQQQAVVR